MKTGNITQSRRPEWAILIVVIALVNLPLLSGAFSRELIFLPGKVLDGEWWRVLTHPFVHVSPYHLLVDATAFFILYYGLIEKSLPRRVGYLSGAATGSVIASLFAAPAIATIGLCGLSGIAHGLMAISALEYMNATRGQKNRTPFVAGAICLLLVVSKSAIEALTGQVVLSGMHMGNVGIPIAVCHAGGVLGALLSYLVTNRRELAASGAWEWLTVRRRGPPRLPTVMLGSRDDSH